MLGIVGKSGAGKSTLVNLISRLYDPDEGEVRLDGIDVRDLAFSSLRGAVAMVSQETYIFMGTVSENIAYARPDATREEIVRAAVAASAHGFICRLPHGYDTVIGSGGRELSGGERQRLSIARAILADPQILVLDEATASVDTETERAIQDSLDELVQGRTTISIAHRLSTLRSADHLIVLDNGELVESGTHAELVEKRGVYYKLLQLQTKALAMRGSNRDGSRIWSILRMPGLIRYMEPGDVRTIVREETAQGDAVSVEKYDMRLGIRPKTAPSRWWRYIMGRWRAISMCTGKRDRTLCRYGHPGDRGFRRAGKIPQKRDRHPPYGRGRSSSPGHTARVCLGVGLHSGYGGAQRLYAKRGYLPDGSGVWYRDAVCEPYAICRNDDDLILYLSKVFDKETGR